MRTTTWATAVGRAIAAGLAIAAGAAPPAPGGGRAEAQVSLFDPRFEDVRRASVAWDNRLGPPRQVVDMVCLVPDVPTFLEAVAAWDQGHYFPVLIDDAELNLKFLRAFRPARVVRYPSRADPVAADQAWARAVEAVSRSWAPADAPDADRPPGDTPPTTLGPTPPGVVVSAPESPALAGAVALAAGRFQPLLRWAPTKHAADVLNADEARALALGLETVVSDRIGRYDALGDDCDFVTLAGDYPFRYLADGEASAFDDLILRTARDGRRWAYAGRLTGDPARSAYAAMCALFLHPDRALMFNAYGQKDRPWTDYAMKTAAATLSKSLPVTLREGAGADLTGWHKAFDPINRFGLVLVNTHGSPTVFNLDGGPGQTADVPETVPAAVAQIHSYSAAEPEEHDTIAGRWRANGAFVYFGAMNEPFLQAFRSPRLVASFLAENLPMVVALRQSGGEPFGRAWRLVYFGDPLYRVRPVSGTSAARAAAWPPVSAWPAYGAYRRPPDDTPEALRLNWALKTALFRLQTGSPPPGPDGALRETLIGLARDRLAPTFRPVHDALLVDTLLYEGKADELIDRLARVPPADRTPALRRHLETAQTGALQRAVARGDFARALALWDEAVRAPGSADFVATFTARVARLADTPARRAAWGDRLRAARAGADPANAPVLDAEAKRVTDLR